MDGLDAGRVDTSDDDTQDPPEQVNDPDPIETEPEEVVEDLPQTGVLADAADTLSPERRAEIDGWVDENANAQQGRMFEFIRGKEDVGGDLVGEALQGESSLGELTEVEGDYLAEEAVESWLANGSGELTDLRNHLGDDPAAEASVARALAGAARDREYGDRLGIDMLEEAVRLDPVETIEVWSGDTQSLGIIAEEFTSAERGALLSAVADGSVTGPDAEQLVNAMFVRLDKRDANELSSEFAGALAAVARAPEGDPDFDRAAMTERLEQVLSTEGGIDLLLNRDITPPLRTWALGMVQTDPGFTAANLADGWASGVVATAQAELAAPGFENLAGLDFSDPDDFDALTNTVGTTLGEAPDMGIPENETPAQRQARLEAGLGVQYYSDDTQAHRVAEAISEQMGVGDQLSVIPVTVTADEFGVYRAPLFRIDHEGGGTTFVDNTGRDYESVEDWRDHNELPPGTMVVPEGLEPGADLAAPEATHAVVDTGWERFVQIADRTATGLGIAAGALAVGALVVGSGGTATPFLIAGAAGAGALSGGWAASRGIGDLIDGHQHGEHALDLTDPATRGNWFDVVSGGLSVFAVGPAIQGIRGATTTATAARGFAAIELAGTVVDGLQAGDRGIQLAMNWDQLTPAQRTAGMLEVAVFAGLGTANVASSGGVRNAFDFNRMARQFETGTPFRIQDGVADLEPGTARVAYDLDANGRATNIRLETNGDVPLDVIRRHSWAAERVESAGGMVDRLRGLVGADRPAIGSAAWEAEIEIGKIQQEAGAISRALADPNLSDAQRLDLEIRAEEIDAGLAYHAARLDQWDTPGQGWINDATRGQEQAVARWGDVASDVPAGHTWVAGADGTPHLRQYNSEVDPFEFVDGQFQRIPDPPGLDDMIRAGNGLNRLETDPPGVFRTADGEIMIAGRDGEVHPISEFDVRDNVFRGRYGEVATDQWARAQGWERVSDGGQIPQMDDGFRGTGIDAVYRIPGEGGAPDRFVVVESKFGDSQLGYATGPDGQPIRQMSDEWILDRLPGAGLSRADLRAIDRDGFEAVVLRVDQFGRVTQDTP
jgi:hypothetical protein